MERVAFLVESTGQRVGCLLNPDGITVHRQAGVRTRRTGGGALTGASLADDPLLFTGGGRTEVRMNLLFDVALEPSAEAPDDVRELTSPLWELAENGATDDQRGRPPLVRFVWGKSWNIPGVVTSVAERLEQFAPSGAPRRSWLCLSFLRSLEADADAGVGIAPALPDGSVLHPVQGLPELGVEQLARAAAAGGEEVRSHSTTAGERLDQIARRYYGFYGHPSLWRPLAAFNNLADPLHIPPGLVLRIPPLSTLVGGG